MFFIMDLLLISPIALHFICMSIFVISAYYITLNYFFTMGMEIVSRITKDQPRHTQREKKRERERVFIWRKHLFFLKTLTLYSFHNVCEANNISFSWFECVAFSYSFRFLSHLISIFLLSTCVCVSNDFVYNILLRVLHRELIWKLSPMKWKYSPNTWLVGLLALVIFILRWSLFDWLL